MENWGWGCFVNLTPMYWQTFTQKKYNSSDFDSVARKITVTPLTFELYATYTWINTEYDLPAPSNTTRVNLDMGLTLKSLGASISSVDKNLFLGSSQDFFLGILFGLDIHYSGNKTYFYATYIPPLGRNSAEISGLTGFQIIGGISLATSVVKIAK